MSILSLIDAVGGGAQDAASLMVQRQSEIVGDLSTW